jgi:hypothetical protein
MGHHDVKVLHGTVKIATGLLALLLLVCWAHTMRIISTTVELRNTLRQLLWVFALGFLQLNNTLLWLQCVNRCSSSALFFFVASFLFDYPIANEILVATSDLLGCVAIHLLIETVIKIFKAVPGLKMEFHKFVEFLTTLAFWSTIVIATITITLDELNQHKMLHAHWAPKWLRLANRLILLTTAFALEGYALLRHWANGPKSSMKKAVRNRKLRLLKVYAISQLIVAILAFWQENCTIAIEFVEICLALVAVGTIAYFLFGDHIVDAILDFPNLFEEIRGLEKDVGMDDLADRVAPKRAREKSD